MPLTLGSTLPQRNSIAEKATNVCRVLLDKYQHPMATTMGLHEKDTVHMVFQVICLNTYTVLHISHATGHLS
eukprot:2111656-Amphidinium_carterae.1